MKGLSPRLARIADLVGAARAIADIGSDHGRLPLALVEAGIVQYAIAVEVSEGPFHTVRTAVERSQRQEAIFTRFGNGLDPIQPREADAIILAGMGAQTMWDILTTEHAQTVLRSGSPSLILQPMGGAGLMRYFAAGLGYEIAEDVRVVDHGIIYECLVLRNRKQGAFYELSAAVIAAWRAAYDALPPSERMRLLCGERGVMYRCHLLAKQIQSEMEKRNRMMKSLAYPLGQRAIERIAQVRAEYIALQRIYKQHFHG